MRDTAAGPRVLLSRLREIMAEPLEPQDRLDKIVAQIAANMVAEVCSLYVLRADGVLELYATEGLKPGRRPPGAAAARPGPRRHDRRERAAAQPVRRAEAPGLRLPAGDGRGDLQLLPRRAGAARRPHARRAGRPEPHHARTIARTRSRRCETTAMVLAEMIATGDLARLTRPGLELDLQPAGHASPASAFNEGVGLGHVVLHEPRVVVTNLFDEDSERGDRAGSTRRSARCASRSTTCCRAATSPSRASTATCSKPTACSPTTAAGCAGCEEAIRNGLTAEAAVEKVQSDTRARMHAHDRPLSARAAARFRRPRQPAAARS